MGSLSSLDILVVEDNHSVRTAISFLLKKSGFAVEEADNGISALEKLQVKYFDLVISDYKMKQLDGIQLLTEIKKHWPATEVIIITAFGTISRGVEAIKLGAFDYITKPFDNRDLLRIVERLVEHRKAGERSCQQRQKVRSLAAFDAIVGESDEIHDVLEMVARIATMDSTILITGESGTGKELIAKSVHALSPRKQGPFVAINCGAIPENLQESEFFGHKKGTFTGADQDKQGLFEDADGGTVFLDEIAEMSPATQVKLLRFLQDSEVRRIGDSFARKVDVRVVSATNQNLEKAIADGRFREDLYYRINVIPLHVPSLRERKQDIPLLIEHFIEKYATHARSPVKLVSKRATSMLLNYDWPGNVRELENVIHRGVALATAAEITPELLPDAIRVRAGAHNDGKRSGNLAAIEKRAILETLERMDGNKKKTAKELGISKTTLWRKLRTE